MDILYFSFRDIITDTYRKWRRAKITNFPSRAAGSSYGIKGQELHQLLCGTSRSATLTSATTTIESCKIVIIFKPPAAMKTISVAFVLTGLLAVTVAYPLRNRESEEREALVQMLLRNLIGDNNKDLQVLSSMYH